MKGYSIYRDNTVIYEFVVDDTISKSLSGNKYVSFTISSKNDLDLKIGDYVLVGNEKYEIFGPIDIEESNGVFTYPLTFYFQGYKLNNSIITDEGATTFAYHGEVSDFMTLLIDSLNEDYPEFTLGTIQNGSILDLSFDNSNCMAALQTVCENAKMEWDITGTIITVKSRIGEETDHVFEYGRNKGSYSVKLAKVANASITTRMIGKGGTLNLPADYVSPDSPKRLNLGNEVLEKNVNKYGKITGVYTNENIYPRLINKTVLGVTIPDNIEEAGSWKIKLDIPFNLSDYYADNEVPVVKFQTGDLTGLDFEIVENSWNNTDKTLSIIVKEEEDGYYLPNANRQPRVGDVFVLLNINMPQSYIDEATQELREATQNELNKKCEPQYAPSLSVQKHYIKKKGISLNIGDGITVKIGRRNITTRIIGTTETSDDIRVELGDQMLYTYDTKVNNTIEQIQFTLKQLINIDDIKRLFYNLINAWYPKWFNQKLHKDADVEFNSVKAAELVQSDNFSSKNFTSGALGSGHRIKDGNAEFQNLTVRGQFSVFEFLIQQVKAIGGKFCVSPAAIKTGSVEETENGYKCFFNTDSGTIINPFVVGDQAFHQVFDGQKMKRYWRLVTEVGADYFVLSKTDCEANSGIPEADEEIVLLGNRTDINRQSAIMISAHDNNSPYIAFYAGINSYSFEGKEPMRTGNLNGIVDEDFGQLTGFGLYCQNVYMKGVFRLMSGKTVEESIGDVQSSLDNLQVGETNLLDNSNKGWKNTGYPIATIYLGDYKPKQGEECTIVIKGKLGANKTSWGVYNSGGNVVLASFYPGGPDTDYIALKTFKWTLGTPAVDNTFIRIYPIPNNEINEESEIEWVKLVLGNKTSLLWTPSINDQRQIAIDEAGKVVDGIQIGGVNILIGSTTGTGWTGYTEHKDTEFSIKDASTRESYIRSAMITIPGNKEIVVSFYAKHTGHQNYFDFYILPASYPEIDALLTSSYQSGTDWTYNEFKFTTPSGWGEGTLVYLRIDHNGMSDGSEVIISVKDVQIEYGNKATTYSVPESDRKEIISSKTYRETEIDLRAEKWDQDTYYTVTIKLPINETRIEVATELGDAKPKWSIHEYGFSMNCVWRSNASGWGANVINRIIEVFECKFTKEIPDTTPVQYILPAGSIGQLASSSEELIYLRGGGRYLFRIGNNCVAVVHDSRYTAPDGSSVAPAASVIRPVLTNATKEELNAEINITKGLIENKVSLDVYNANDQLIKSDISSIQTRVGSVETSVKNVINGTTKIAGVLTTSEASTLYASKTLENGKTIIGYINQTADTTTINAERINLNGAVVIGDGGKNSVSINDGKLTAVNAEITGKITATSGIIGGFKIGSTYIQNGGLKLSSGSIEYKGGNVQANFGALYTGISGYEIGLYIKNKAPSTGTQRACAYFEGSIGNVEIASSRTMINISSVPSTKEALRIESGQVYMNANSGGIFFENVQNINGESNYYLCIRRSDGKLYYR